MKKNLRRRRGFTLMEILLVLAILVVLGSLVTVGYVQIQKNAMIDSARTQIKLLGEAVDLYRLEVGSYPSGDQGLESLRFEPPGAPAGKWRGPYFKADLPKDPWGNDFVYEQTQDQFGEDSFQITSFGPDRQSGTNDDIRLHP